MEDHSDMKKSNIWTILVPAIFCVGVFICVFIWRNTAGSQIHLSYSFFSATDTKDKQTDKNTHQSTNKIIDINKADWEELATLPGIGEALARRIVEFRNKNGPFTSKEELLRVSGIGEKKLNDIISYIMVGGLK